MPSENVKLNPQIATIEIGIRNLRKIKIYPLAVGPQLKLIENLSEGAQLFSNLSNDSEAIGNIIALIVQNIPKILNQLIDTRENVEQVLKEITISQMELLALLVYEMNFESLAKNVQSLVARAMIGAEAIEAKNKKQVSKKR